MIFRKINILFITHYSSMYGANQSLCRLMIELREKYNICPIVLLSQRGEICEFLDQNNISYYVSHFYWWVNEDKGVFQYILNLRKQFRNWIHVKSWVRLIEKEKIDLIYSNSFTINIGTFISRKLKCPHIWYIRESLEQFKFKLSLGKLISKMFLKNAADKFILISDFLIKVYTDLLPAERVERIYNGIDFTRVNTKSVKKVDTFNLCMVGIISEQKNNLDAVKALFLLINKYKLENVQLHLIGGNKAEYLELLNKYIDENELSRYVFFHGHTKAVDVLLSTMHLGLMCSNGEAFGRVSVEYMMHSIPVIASNSGANPEIIKEDINGSIYTLYNSTELAEKIYKFVTQPELLKQLGQTAYLYGKANFSSEQNTAAIYDVIEELVNNR